MQILSQTFRIRVFPTVIVFLITLFFTGCEFFKGPQPPLARLQNAKDAVARAATFGSIRYAEGTYREAERLMQSGWMEMARQNGRISIFRNYYKADSLLRLAEEVADRGLRKTQDSLNSLDEIVWREIKEYENELHTWRDALDGSLVIYIAERVWSGAELHLRSAKQLARVKEFQEAQIEVVRGKNALTRLGNIISERAGNEAAHLKKWRNWVDEVVERSRREGSYALAVDKVAHRTYLLKNGRTVHKYKSELGYNSANPKLFAGDGATPEGIYKITKVKNGNTKFYRALLLDYPNETDKWQFVENKRKGIISRGSSIGKLIEIHGDGGKGNDWTDGCVALSNSDMDHLFKYVGVGTPVVIVRRYDGDNLE